MNSETVLITGSSRGIGRSIACKFAENGYNVVLNCSGGKDELDASVSALRVHNKNIVGIMADVSDYEQVERMFQAIPPHFGPVSVLVNNAAVSHVGLFTDMTPAQWRRVVEVNLLSALNCCHLAVPGMVRRRRGAIINISSVWGCAGASCEAVYAASKGGLNSFTKSLAKELALSGVRVNAIACGVVDTRMNDFLSEAEKEELAAGIPLGRFARAEEIADAAYFLSSWKSAYITGQILAVNGGMY